MEAFFKWLMNLFKAILGLTDTTITIEPNPSYPELDDVIDSPIPEDVTPKDPNKYAVLIGINKYLEPGNDLNGCVNDVEAVWDVLVNLYDFDPANIRVLTDERATRNAMLEAIEWLVYNRLAGDELFLHYSGHGSQVVDWSGDELSDGLDEIIIPYDNDWNYPLSDDIIHDLFKQVNPDAYLTFVCDSCHSGTMTRGLTENESKPADWGKDNRLIVKGGSASFEKFIRPPIDIALRARNRDLKIVHLGMKEKDVIGIQKHVLLSGCRDDEYSADAFIGDSYRGALSAAMEIAMRENPYRSWVDVHIDIISMLKGAEFDQNPMLSGAPSLVSERTILGGKS